MINAEKAAAEKRRIEALEEQRKAGEDQKAKFEKERKQKLEQVLSNLSEDEIAELQAEFIANIKSNDLLSKILQKKGLDNPMLQPQRQNFLAERFLASYYHRFDAYDKKTDKVRDEEEW